MNGEVMKKVISEVVTRFLSENPEGVSIGKMEIPVGVSARHVHLSETDVETLFGNGYTLTKKRDISQPGQYLCEERVTLIGPKNVLQNVAVLGPVRKQTQVEVSISDARMLGANPPIAMSGDLQNAESIMIAGKQACIKAEKSLIVAKNHVHMSAQEARQAGVNDGDIVDVILQTERPVIFRKVPVRAGDGHKLEMHIDVDEANACLYKAGDKAILSKCTGTAIPAVCEEKNAEKESVRSTKVMNISTKFVTEQQVRAAISEGYHLITVKEGAMVSLLAQDLAREKSVEICRM